ncbi:MAG: hypothetical protein EBQ89_09285 [Alphaproteobacteria bacterium]|nr:hypothetical protein [Alphaproteobacteria bacterium]
MEHWRHTQKVARFFFLDARLFVVFMFVLLHIRPWTLIVAGLLMLIFWVFEQRGLTFEAALRAFRFWLLGRWRPAVISPLRRRYGDSSASQFEG